MMAFQFSTAHIVGHLDSMYPPSSSIKDYRSIPLLVVHSRTGFSQKNMFCCSLHPRKGSYRKLIMVPCKNMSDVCAPRSWAAYGYRNSNGRNWEIGASSDILFSNDSRGSSGLLAVTESPQGRTSDFEKQLEELFYEVKSMIKIGKEQDAACLLQANYVALKEQMDEGVRGIEEAAILVVIALGYMAIGDIKMVRSLMDMLSGIVDNLEDDEPLLDSILTHMGSMCSAMGKSENAMLAYRRAIAILEKNYGKNCTPLINPLLGMGKLLGSMGRANKASEVYDQVINIMEVNRGGQCEDLVVPLLGLGNLLMKEGKVEDAENAFSRIVSIYQKIYGDKDRRFGMALCSLAHAKCAQGNANEAINLYKDALRILKDSKYISLDDAMMDKIRIDLVELLHIAGRAQEGHEILEECLLIAEECYGKDHPNYVLHLINIAASYSSSKNYVEAERLLRMSLDILTKSVGPDDQAVTFPKLHLAVSLYNLHKYDEAEKLALEVLHIREKAFGKESIPVGEAIECLVSIKARMEKYENDDEIVELLKRLLVIQENEFGHESEDALETLKKLHFYLDKMGMKEEKLRVHKRLTMLRKKYSETSKILTMKRKRYSSSTESELEAMEDVFELMKEEFDIATKKQQRYTLESQEVVEVIIIEIQETLRRLETHDEINYLWILEYLKEKLAVAYYVFSTEIKNIPVYAALDKYFQLVQKNFLQNISRAYRNVEMDSRMINQIIIGHLYQKGLFEVGDLFAKESGEEEASAGLRTTFFELHGILGSLRNGYDIEPALKWVAENSCVLREEGVTDLEFKLRRLVFSEILQKPNGRGEALQYVREVLMKTCSDHEEGIKKLMLCLLWEGRLEESPYCEFAPSIQFEKVCGEFGRVYLNVIGKSERCPLISTVAAGMQSLPVLLKMMNTMMRGKAKKWQMMNKLPVKVNLDQELQFHSRMSASRCGNR